MKKITPLDDILKAGNVHNSEYDIQVKYIKKLVAEGKIKPVKNAPSNGKTPPLKTRYWVIVPDEDYSELINELDNDTHKSIDITHYKKHIKRYKEERRFVRELHEFLKYRAYLLEREASYNERSFQIWRREKYIKNFSGKTILQHCGLSIEDLNCYETSPPIAYYAASKKTPQNILIVENLDTFYTIRRLLMKGNACIFNLHFETVIYGAGKNVEGCFRHFDISAEEFMKHPDNTFYYFGDLDYTGIGIFERLANIFKVTPLIAAYELMVRMGYGLDLPLAKPDNVSKSDMFFGYFQHEVVEIMQEILKSGLYVPQEIITMYEMENSNAVPISC